MALRMNIPIKKWKLVIQSLTKPYEIHNVSDVYY